MKRICLVCVAVFAYASGWSQNDDSVIIRKIANEILTNGRAYGNLRVLCKMIGPRLTASPQMYKAESWGRQLLMQAGADTVWMQECKVPHWIRGGADKAWVTGSGKAERMMLDVLALGNSQGTGANGISAPVILINSFEELEQHKDEIKGKIVFYNYKFNPLFIGTFDGYVDAVPYRVVGASRAAKYGAVAVVVRSITSATDNNPHTGALIYNDSFPKIPAAAVGLTDADRLAALLNSKKSATLFLKTGGRMLDDTVGRNVIGELVGSEFKDEIITVGGHYDSWDPAEGAHDDGAGCVHAIEVLRVLKAIGYHPRHTIRAVLFVNEENGLRGGLKYAEEAERRKEKHVFALESDEGGFTPRGFDFIMKPEQLAKVRQWAHLLEPYGAFEFVDGGGGADIGGLQKLGTPLAGYLPDSQRYFDVHHARSDVFENVNRRELEMGAITIAALIYLVDKYGL